MSARAVVDRVVVVLSRACTSSACRANTCCAVTTRCARPPPKKATVQLNRTESRFLKPVSDVRRTTSQSRQAGKPETCSRPTTAIARRRDMVAIEPISRYRSGWRAVSPARRRVMVSAACWPDWIATCVTPGRLSRLMRSPITNTSGCPRSVQSGSTVTRPVRSSSTLALSGKRCGRAARPEHRQPRSSSPSRCASRLARSRPCRCPPGPRQSPLCRYGLRLPGRRRSRAARVSKSLGKRRQDRRRRAEQDHAHARPDRCHGSSRAAFDATARRAALRAQLPSGRRRITTNVSQRRRAAASVSRSAISNAPRIRRRSSSA